MENCTTIIEQYSTLLKTNHPLNISKLFGIFVISSTRMKKHTNVNTFHSNLSYYICESSQDGKVIRFMN